MKKLTDQEMQLLFESHINIEPTDEVELYQKVFSELSKLPNIHVTPLAQDVVTVLQKQAERNCTIKTYLAIAFAIAIGICIFIVGLFTVDKLIATKFLRILYSYKWIITSMVIITVISTTEQNFFSTSKFK